MEYEEEDDDDDDAVSSSKNFDIHFGSTHCMNNIHNLSDDC
jgi:hypothetical protein